MLCWNESCKIGHPILDTDREHLVRQINLLHKNLALPSESETIVDIQSELVYYAFQRLECEEKILKELGLEEDAAHMQEHLDFQEFIAEHCLHATYGNANIERLLYFLFDWWEGHALGTDMDCKLTLQNDAVP